MVKVISAVLLAGAVLNAFIDKFNTQNIIIIVLSGLLTLFSLVYGKPSEAVKVQSWKVANGVAFSVVTLSIILASVLFPAADIYSFSGDVNKAAALISSGDYKQAEKLLLKLYGKNESDAAVNLNLGVIYLKKHNTDLAKTHLERGSYGLYSDENLWFNFGLVYYQNKDYQKARESFERAVQLNPGFLKANIYAGTMSYRTGDMKRSIYHLRNAEFLKPDSAEIQLHLGRAFAGIMEYDSAIDCFKKALELKPAKELKKAIEEQISEAESAKGGAGQ